MTHRQFRDSNAVEWEVWEVKPVPTVQPLLDRRSRPRAAGGPAEQSRTAEFLLPLPGMSRGWLLFESDTEKRRLVPIPEGWVDLPVEALEALCGRATPVRRAPEARTAPAPETRG